MRGKSGGRLLEFIIAVVVYSVGSSDLVKLRPPIGRQEEKQTKKQEALRARSCQSL